MNKVYKLGSAGADVFKKLDAAEDTQAGKKIDMLLMSAIAVRGAA